MFVSPNSLGPLQNHLWIFSYSNSSFFFYVVVWKDISGDRANKAKSEEKYIRSRSNIVFATYRFGFAFDNLESDEWHQVSQLFSTVGTNKAGWSTIIRLVNKPNYH